MLNVLLLVLVAALSLFLILKQRRNDISLPLPPGPRGLPVLGYLPFLGDNLSRKFTELANIYGPIYKLYLGRKLHVVVSSAALAKEIVWEHDRKFANRDPNIASRIIFNGGKDIVFADYGPHWRMMRKLFVREVMGIRSLNACYGLRRRVVRKLVAEVGKMVGSPVDVGNLALRTMVDLVVSMTWGSSLGKEMGDSLDSEFKVFLKKLLELMVKPNVSDFFPVISRFDLQGVEREAREVTQWFDRLLDSVIESAMEEKRRRLSKERKDARRDDQKEDLLQLLLELDFESEDNSPCTQSNNLAIKGILIDIMVGGTDTAATMVEWVMAELLQHRDVMRKVMEELTEVIGIDSTVEEHSLPKLKYLEATIKESFRLHPAVPLLVPRIPDTACVVGGYTIPKGCMVFLNVAFIHMDPKLWENPADFMPERFLKDPGEFDFSGNNFAYMPFGSGRRMCAGLPLAEKMLMFVLANLLHSFDWELPEGTELEFSQLVAIVAKKKTPLVAIPTPRLVNQEFTQNVE